MHTIPITLQAELLGRLLLSVVLSSVLGWERQVGRHPAGLRTHMLVALGACAYTLAGTYGVAGLGTVQDAGRVASQIVTGIGFLGAGTIWRSSAEDGVIRGLTTAASIWVAAAIGMMSGYGLYVLAPGCAILGFTVLRLLKGAERAPNVLRSAIRRGRPDETRNAAAGAAYQPARPPGMTESPPAAAPDALAGGEPPVTRTIMHKRPRKKDRKRKRRGPATEPVDQISDAPEIAG